jgi:5-methylthioribose kinase
MGQAFFALDTTTALAYIDSHPIRSQFFAADDELVCLDLADGNVNLVFRIHVKGNPQQSIILKQALPFARRYPEFKMPLDRARIEVDILRQQQTADPGRVPTVYHFDPEMYVNIMEDLRSYHIMREGMVKQRVYPRFAIQTGQFLARTLVYSSDLFLESGEKKAREPLFVNAVLCKVTEDLVYTFPFGEHETNRYPAPLQKQVASLYADDELQKQVARCRLAFMTRRDCLVHGDLHTGSIMVHAEDTKVMDPEFGFYGPFGFDIGMLIANLAIAYVAQEAHAPSAAACAQYRSFLKDTMKELWQACVAELKVLLETQAKPEWRKPVFINDFLETLEHDAIKHMGCEMIRRTIGMAHVLELDEIQNEQLLVAVSSQILTIAQQLMHDDVRAINDALGLLEPR